MIREPLGKLDFHLHSRASNVTDYFAANALSLPESYSDPLALYRLLKQRGMSLVTLTDHNSIDGALELLSAGFTDVFISAEMTTTFPEDGCNIHVTVANVTEPQFREANRLRGNVYEMIAYLDGLIAGEPRSPGHNRIAYFMTHPLMSTQNRPYGREGALQIDHIEKALLLCNCIEVHNGARTRTLNRLTRQMVESLDRAGIERLANKHNLPPKGDTPWLKAIVGGSDDHSGINPGRTWTEFPFSGATPAANDVVDAIRRRETRTAGDHGGPITLAHAVVKLLYDGSRQRSNAGSASGITLSGPLASLLDLVFDFDRKGPLEKLRLQARAKYHRLMARNGGPGRSRRSFEAVLGTEVWSLLDDPAFRRSLGEVAGTDDRIFLVVKTLVNRIFAGYVARIRAAENMTLVGAVKELVALVSSQVFVSLPYLISFLQQSSDCMISRDVRKAFGLEDRQKLVLVTDTFFEINGVSVSIRRMLREAIRRDIPFTVVTCLGPGELETHCARDPEVGQLIEAGRLRIFTSVVNLDFPQYDGLQIHFPPLLDMMRYLQESGFTKVQISTPGTIGVAGLFCAKLLQIETAATYHTSIPEYVENYTRDVSLEAMAWKYMILFYHAVDEVLVPSTYIARLLHKRGMRNRKLLILDRWVDLERFQPGKRVAGYWQRHGINNEDTLTKFIYVGRVAVEKDLHLLAAAYRRLLETRGDAHLIIVGDGPYRQELEAQLRGLPATFTGFLQGEELPRALASADVKLFPSTTDTWGNAPLEAQACGLPVVVSDIGGPAELMEDGVTGFRVPGRDVEGLYQAMLTLMDPAIRARMGRAARTFVEIHRVDEPFTAVLDSAAYRERLLAARAGAEAGHPPLMTRILDLTGAQFERDAASLEETPA